MRMGLETTLQRPGSYVSKAMDSISGSAVLHRAFLLVFLFWLEEALYHLQAACSNCQWMSISRGERRTSVCGPGVTWGIWRWALVLGSGVHSAQTLLELSRRSAQYSAHVPRQVALMRKAG